MGISHGVRYWRRAKAINCSFTEIIDLPNHDNTLVQCPVCGAYRTVTPAYQEGDVYRFPAHKPVDSVKSKSAWQQVGNTWKWIE